MFEKYFGCAQYFEFNKPVYFEGHGFLTEVAARPEFARAPDRPSASSFKLQEGFFFFEMPNGAVAMVSQANVSFMAGSLPGEVKRQGHAEDDRVARERELGGVDEGDRQQDATHLSDPSKPAPSRLPESHANAAQAPDTTQVPPARPPLRGRTPRPR